MAIVSLKYTTPSNPCGLYVLRTTTVRLRTTVKVVKYWDRLWNPQSTLRGKWATDVMLSANGNIFRVTGPLWRELASHWWNHKVRWREAVKFSWICAWPNCWVHNRDAGDLRRNRADYAVTVMYVVYIMPCTLFSKKRYGSETELAKRFCEWII